MIKSAANPSSLKSPTDTVSDMQFVMTSSKLLLGCCSWDGMVIIYEVDQAGSAKPIMEHKSKDKVAYLRFCFQPDGTCCFVATSSHQIIQIKIPDKTETVIGSHGDRIVGLRYLTSQNQLVSCSIDKTVQIWDIAKKQSVKKENLKQKPTYMSCSENMIAVSLLSPPTVQISTAELKFGELQGNRQREGLPVSLSVGEENGAYFYLAGYTHGNVEMGSSKMNAFQIIEDHRNDAASSVYCVNAVAVAGDNAVSGGTDGKVSFYKISSGQKTNEIDLGKGKNPVVALALAPNAPILAAALGNDWSKGSGDTTKYTNQVIVTKY